MIRMVRVGVKMKSMVPLRTLWEELLDVGQDKCDQHDGQHGTLVARLLNLQTEEVPVGHGVGTSTPASDCCDVVAIHQGRGDHCRHPWSCPGRGYHRRPWWREKPTSTGRKAKGAAESRLTISAKSSHSGEQFNEGLGPKDTLRGQEHVVDAISIPPPTSTGMSGTKMSAMVLMKRETRLPCFAAISEVVLDASVRQQR